MAIYFDNAATTRTKPDCVIQAVVEAMTSMGNSGRGSHESSLDASRVIYETRVLLAELFGADHPSQIAFTLNSTESLNTAILGLLGPGDHVITTVMEHNSVLRPLYRLERAGVSLSFLPCDDAGRLRYEYLEQYLQKETKAVVCTHASNLTGNSVDLYKIGEFCQKHHLLFIVDASQTAGVLPINMQEMGMDVLCFTGHKGLFGPQGTGGLCVRKGICIQPLKSGGSGIHTYDKEHPDEMPEALEAGTLNGHGIAGLRAALGYIREMGVSEIHRQEMILTRRFYEGVKDIEGVKLYGDFNDPKKTAIVALNIRDYDSSEVSDELAMCYGISIRPGAHCAPLMHQALGTVEQGIVRFSFSCFNTEAEIEAGIKAVTELAR